MADAESRVQFGGNKLSMWFEIDKSFWLFIEIY